MTNSTSVQLSTGSRDQSRRVAAATLIGSAIEWYDFFVYATAASLVFATEFFEPAGGQAGLLLSFASIGISFLFRPLGAFLAGHFGDRIGRKAMLIATLLLMGVATLAIGFLPTFAAVGIAAPIMLVILRIFQGLAAGGEWGGAALMAVEHAPAGRRGVFGAFPQLGVPLGLLLSSGVFTLVSTVIAPGDAFVAWGWRIPFILSIVLVIVGFWLRRAVDESPVFAQLAERKQQETNPVGRLFRNHTPLVILAALFFAGNGAAGYLITGGFVTAYVTGEARETPLERSAVLGAITIAGIFYFVSTLLAGWLSDKIGRRRATLLGFGVQFIFTLPFFFMLDSGSIVVVGMAMAAWYFINGMTYGPQSAWYAEMFPASMRYTGVSLAYALGAILGGAFAPMISQALVQQFATPYAVAVYILVITAIAFIAAALLRDRSGIDLSIDNEAEQSHGATVFSR